MPTVRNTLTGVYIQPYTRVEGVRLSEEAYKRLEAHNGESGTVSNVILRLAGERSLLELAGMLTDDPADAVEERRERFPQAASTTTLL